MPRPEATINYIDRYLQEARKYPLLEREEVNTLAKSIEEKGNKLLWAIFSYDSNFLVAYLSNQDSKDSKDKSKTAEKVQDLLMLQKPIEEKEFYVRLEQVRQMVSFVGVYRDVGETYLQKIKDEEGQLLDGTLSDERQIYDAEEIKITELQGKRKQLEELISAWKEPREVLAQHNLLLVISPAKKRAARSNFDLFDCIIEGNNGLYKGIDGFDYRRGNTLSTYASWWIKQAIDRYIANNCRMIRMSIPFQVKMSAIRKIENGLRIRLGLENVANEEIAAESLRTKARMKAKKTKKEYQEPTAEQIAAEAIKIKAVRLSFYEVDSHSSLEETIGDHGKLKKDLIPDIYSPNPESEVDLSERSGLVTAALSSLSGIEQDVICRRFGIGYDCEYSLTEIGQTYHLSRERIRQLESQALKRLRKRPEIMKMRS